jgi:hypothetical protein
MKVISGFKMQEISFINSFHPFLIIYTRIVLMMKLFCLSALKGLQNVQRDLILMCDETMKLLFHFEPTVIPLWLKCLTFNRNKNCSKITNVFTPIASIIQTMFCCKFWTFRDWYLYFILFELLFVLMIVLQ